MKNKWPSKSMTNLGGATSAGTYCSSFNTSTPVFRSVSSTWSLTSLRKNSSEKSWATSGSGLTSKDFTFLTSSNSIEWNSWMIEFTWLSTEQCYFSILYFPNTTTKTFTHNLSKPFVQSQSWWWKNFINFFLKPQNLWQNASKRFSWTFPKNPQCWSIQRNYKFSREKSKSELYSKLKLFSTLRIGFITMWSTNKKWTSRKRWRWS